MHCLLISIWGLRGTDSDRAGTICGWMVAATGSALMREPTFASLASLPIKINAHVLDDSSTPSRVVWKQRLAGWATKTLRMLPRMAPFAIMAKRVDRRGCES